MYGILLPINPIIIALCIFLMFETFHDYYDKRCAFCDTFAIDCFEKMFERKRRYKVKGIK